MPAPKKYAKGRYARTAAPWLSLALMSTAVAQAQPTVAVAAAAAQGAGQPTCAAPEGRVCEIAGVAAHQTLAQALDAAWARHPQAAAMNARQSEAQARIEMAAGLTPAPASVSLDQKTDRLHRNAGLREWEVALATPLWLPGQRAARSGEANRHAQELDARAAHLRWQLAGEIREAWWAVAAARETRQLAGQRQDSARALASSVQQRVDTGDLARLDANLANGERLAAQAEVLEADKALRQAEQAYRNLTGDSAPATLPGEAPSTTSLDALARTTADTPAATHPRLQWLRATQALADSRVALADASRRESPEIALRWMSERSEATRPYERSVGIRLTLPLSSSSRVGQEGAAARAELAQTEAEVALAQTRIEQDMLDARSEYETTADQLSLAREHQSLATDNLHLAQRSFELGESDLPALLRARNDARDAETNFHRRQIARELALSRLLQARGVLP